MSIQEGIIRAHKGHLGYLFMAIGLVPLSMIDYDITATIAGAALLIAGAILVLARSIDIKREEPSGN